MTEVIIPYGNPVRLWDVTDEHETFWYDMLPSHEKDPGYAQPFAIGDTIAFQLAATIPPGGVSIKAELVTEEMGVVETFSVTQLTKTYNVLYYHYEARLTLEDTRAGIYYISVVLDTKNGQRELISNPVWVKQAHPDTMLLDYTHKENDYDMIFKISALENHHFYLRVEGGFKSDGYQPGSVDTVYTDQEHDLVQLEGIPTLTRKLTFGKARGIPNYLADIINRIWLCSEVIKDDVQYLKAEGSKIERTGSPNYPLAAWSLDIIQSDNPYSYGSKFLANLGLKLMYASDTYDLVEGVNAIDIPVEGMQVASYQVWEVVSETQTIHQPNVQLEYDSSTDTYSIDMGKATPMTVEIKFTLI